MSGSGKTKKAKPRSSSKKNSNQSSPLEGPYANPRLTHVLLSLMGKKCHTKLRNGAAYEGLLHAVSRQMDVPLCAAHRVNTESENGVDHKENHCPKEEELLPSVVFRFDHVVSAKFENVDMNYATLDANEANGESTNQSRTSKTSEKKLEPWNGGGDSASDPLASGSLESANADGTNGWDASDMFKANEERYGVTSDYDSSLAHYTMPLNIDEKKPENVRRATQLAEEIQGSNEYKQRIDLELDDGTTEEDKFSAVHRERDSRKDGRNPRDFRDRDAEHGGYREKDRGDKDQNRISPPYRSGRDHHVDNRYRNRGRARDSYSHRNQQGYSGPVPSSRPMGPGGPPGGDRRHQPPMSQMEGPPGQGAQGKFRNNPPSNIPPRFTKTGSGGHSREDDRMKQNEGGQMHSTYQAPKGQRQPRMNSRGGNSRPWPTSPPTDFSHHNPPPMHGDAAMSGGPTLSRTSSSSSNASVQQSHRKHLSTSSQEEQPPHPGHHIRQSSHQSSSPTGGTMMHNPQAASQRPQNIQSSMQGTPQQEAPSNTWAAVARAKPAQISTQADKPRGHMAQPTPAGLSQTSQGGNPIHVRPDATYSWTPNPSNMPHQQANMSRPPMAVPGVTHQAAPNMQMQMMARGHGQSQRGVVTNTQQLPRQQMPPQNIPAMPTPRTVPQQQIDQMPGKPQNNMPAEHMKQQSDKPEETNKSGMKKTGEATPAQASSANITELKEFQRNFKLSKEVKDTSSTSHHSQNKPLPKQQVQPVMQQPYPSHSGQPSYQQQPTVAQQQVAPNQQPPTHMVTMHHQEHGQVMGVPTATAQIHPNQPMAGPPPKHPGSQQHPVLAAQHRQILPSPMSPQIPVASPSIQHFATPSPHQSPMQGAVRPVDGPKIMNGRVPGDKTNGALAQKPLTSPKVESNYAPSPNIHIVVSQVPQTKPSAVISVSAASPSPIVTSHFQTTVTASAPTTQPAQRQSPTVTSHASPSLSADSGGNTQVPSTSPANAVASPLSSSKALNPEAVEFKPRAPAKAAAVTARAGTPVQQQQSFLHQSQVISHMGQIVTPVYAPGVHQIDPMNPPMNPQMTMYQQFTPPFLPQMMPQIPGQQMQQFATFDQSGQVYQGHAPPAMMQHNARVAIPTTLQQHASQYPQEQNTGTVYAVPVAPQPTGYITQARPRSAHTPTQVAHVTAASPAGQSSQQPPLAVSHPTPAMVPTAHPAGGQQVMMMWPGQMAQAAHPPHISPQTPVPTQYINQVPAGQMSSTVAMAGGTPQQKNHPQQQTTYMPQAAARPYGQFSSAVPNTQ